MLRAGLIFLALVGPAAAQPPCGLRPVIVGQLAEQFGETQRGVGIAQGAAVVELYAAETGTWTIVVTLPNGMACLLASGENWEAVEVALPKKGIDG